jgi:hypothetical protein
MLAAHDRRRLLQLIIDDPASTTLERTEAIKALEQNGAPAPSHRRGRNANAPMSQADTDSDLERELTFRSNDGLTIALRAQPATFPEPA